MPETGTPIWKMDRIRTGWQPGCRVHRILEEIFQIPANIFLVLRGKL